MPILVECPRCKQSLSVADKMAGTSVTCAYCNGRLLVPKSMGGTGPAPTSPEMAVPPPRPASPPPPGTPASAPSSSQGTASPSAGSEPAPTARTRPGAVPPVPQMPTPERSQAQPPMSRSATPPTPPPATVPQRKVARFITAETARSSLTLSADGKLPDLHLTESDQPGAKHKTEKAAGLNPLVLLGVICLSVVTSVMLVFVEVDPPNAQQNVTKWTARRVIEEEYFSNLDSSTPRDRYQICLRDAQRAYARGDRVAERQLYRQVLDLLRAERGPFDTITGTPSRDKRLEEQIIILLRKD